MVGDTAMKTSLSVCISLVWFSLVMLAGAPAIAADLPVKAPVYKAAPPAPFSWSGCYLGGHIGGLWGETNWTDPLGNFGPFINVQDVSHSSFTAGGQIGCNIQVNQFVIGIEADSSWADVNKISLSDTDERRHIVRTRFDWYGSVRGRLGYAADRWLVYATGGFAFSKIDLTLEAYTDSTLTVLSDPILGIRVKSGWTVGGGLEYALTNNWILRAEYLYFDFRNHQIFDFGDGDIEFGHPKFHVGRVGLSYKFDWGAPLAAR